MNVLIMLALLRLGTGSINRTIREGLALPQTLGDLDPVHGAGFLVLVPGGPGDVTADDGLNGEDLQLAHLHASVLEDGTQRLGDLRREVEGEEVGAERGDFVGEDLEPGFRA